MSNAIRSIIRLTAAHFGLSPEQLTAHNRTWRVSRARQVAMRLCCEQGRWSLPKIGERFGGFDHTTVLYARERVAELEAREPAIADALAALRPQVRALLAASEAAARTLRATVEAARLGGRA